MQRARCLFMFTYIYYHSDLNTLSPGKQYLGIDVSCVGTVTWHTDPRHSQLSLACATFTRTAAAENVLIIGQALWVHSPPQLPMANDHQKPAPVSQRRGVRPTCRERRKFLEQTARDRRASNDQPCCGTANKH